MTHLAARSPAASSVRRPERGFRLRGGKLPVTLHAGMAPQNFLEMAIRGFQYPIAYKGTESRSAELLSPAVGNSPRPTRAISAMAHHRMAMPGEFRPLRPADQHRHDDQRRSTSYVRLSEHAMVGSPGPANRHQRCSGENFYAIGQQSGAQIPILQSPAKHKRVMPRHIRVAAGIPDTTPNERSGR